MQRSLRPYMQLSDNRLSAFCCGFHVNLEIISLEDNRIDFLRSFSADVSVTYILTYEIRVPLEGITISASAPGSCNNPRSLFQ